MHTHMQTLLACVRPPKCWFIPTVGRDVVCYCFWPPGNKKVSLLAETCWRFCFCDSLWKRCMIWLLKLSDLEVCECTCTCVCATCTELGWVVVVLLWCKPDVDGMLAFLHTGGRMDPVCASVYIGARRVPALITNRMQFCSAPTTFGRLRMLC